MNPDEIVKFIEAGRAAGHKDSDIDAYLRGKVNQPYSAIKQPSGDPDAEMLKNEPYNPTPQENTKMGIMGALSGMAGVAGGAMAPGGWAAKQIAGGISAGMGQEVGRMLPPNPQPPDVKAGLQTAAITAGAGIGLEGGLRGLTRGMGSMGGVQSPAVDEALSAGPRKAAKTVFSKPSTTAEADLARPIEESLRPRNVGLTEGRITSQNIMEAMQAQNEGVNISDTMHALNDAIDKLNVGGIGGDAKASLRRLSSLRTDIINKYLQPVPPVDIPPVKSGNIRLYRGQQGTYDPSSDTTSFSDAGRWFSTDKNVAEFHGPVRYVDVPQKVSDASIQPESMFQKTGRLIPAEFANKAIPWTEKTAGIPPRYTIDPKEADYINQQLQDAIGNAHGKPGGKESMRTLKGVAATHTQSFRTQTGTQESAAATQKKLAAFEAMRKQVSETTPESFVRGVGNALMTHGESGDQSALIALREIDPSGKLEAQINTLASQREWTGSQSHIAHNIKFEFIRRIPRFVAKLTAVTSKPVGRGGAATAAFLSAMNQAKQRPSP